MLRAAFIILILSVILSASEISHRTIAPRTVIASRRRGNPHEKVRGILRTSFQRIAAVATLLRNDISFYVILSAAKYPTEKVRYLCRRNFYLLNSSARAEMSARLAADTAESIFTPAAVNDIFLLFSNIPFITFAAVDAHEPFSIKPIVLFW